jgi:3-methyladenine DNA glycosylase AlkD
MTREELLASVDALYATDWFDLRSAAAVLLERKRKLLEARDAALVVELCRRSACWAHVDLLAVKVLGHLLAENHMLIKKLPTYARDESFWVRRASLLAQLDELKRGRGDFALFTSLAVPMLPEKEFFIRKAIGWVLREVSKKRPELVQRFLRHHGARASGLTRREAGKYLPG